MDVAITESEISRRFRRVTEAVPAARAFTRRWLPSSELAEQLVLGAAEAINNVVDHAAGEHFTVSVGLDGPTGVVTVTDSGRGFVVPRHPTMPGPFESGRRGLAMMHSLVDQVDIDSKPTGTTVTLAQGLVQEPSLPAEEQRVAEQVHADT